METLIAEPVVVHRTKPVGVPIQKSPAKPPDDPPQFVNDDDDNDGDGGDRKRLGFLKGLRMLLVVIVLCISGLLLLIRRSFLPDWLWRIRLQEVSAGISYHQSVD